MVHSGYLMVRCFVCLFLLLALEPLEPLEAGALELLLTLDLEPSLNLRGQTKQAGPGARGAPGGGGLRVSLDLGH